MKARGIDWPQIGGATKFPGVCRVKATKDAGTFRLWVDFNALG